MSHKTNINNISVNELDIQLSCHARARMQQRGIKAAWIDLLLQYGKYVYQSGKKTYSISLDKRGIKAIKRTLGNLVDIEKLRRIYLVLSHDATLVTCAYR